MCGLVGFVNRGMPSKTISDFIKQSLITNSLRGTDGSGFCVVDEDLTMQYYKRPLPGWDLVQLLPTASILASVKSPLFGLIHNRAGTNGGNKIETSHPVNYKHITLIHNGVVSQLHSLGASWDTHDSTAIAMALADKPEKEALELLVGAYALMWYNANDNTLNVARNEQRPLYIGAIKKSKSLLFASEDGMLAWLAERNNIVLRDITEMLPGTHLKISKDPNIKNHVSKFKINIPAPHTYGGAAIWPNQGSGNVYGHYTVVAKDEEFIGKYDGVLKYSDSRNFLKFKHVGDHMYGWIVNLNDHPNQDKTMKVGDLYKLKAIEPRLGASVCTNLDAVLVSTEVFKVPVLTSVVSPLESMYKAGDEVFFETCTVTQRTKNSSMSFFGYTDDENFAEVRGFNILNPQLEKDTHYRAKIRMFAKPNGKAGEYILIEANSIVEIVKSCVPGGADEQCCGWCSAALTSREVVNNTIPDVSNSGSLCDACHKDYTKLFNRTY